MNLNKNFKFTLGLPLLLSIYKSKLVKNKEEHDRVDCQTSSLELCDLTSEICNKKNINSFHFEEDSEEKMLSSVDPLQFSYLHSQFETSLDFDSWNGLKIDLSWHPTNLFNTGYTITIDNPLEFLKNYAKHATTIILGM